jgi:ribosomal protein S18 acetylase RimI-like enzyme
MASRLALHTLALRPARADDADFMATLSGRVFAAYSRDPETAVLRMASERGADVFIAEAEGEPVGFGVLESTRYEGDFGPFHRPAVARLEAIAVRPDLFGRGVGKRLLAHAEALARERGAVSLSLLTAENNARARRLFGRHGFQALVVIEGAYARGQRGIAMIKALLG